MSECQLHTFLCQFLQLIGVVLLDLASLVKEVNQSGEIPLGVPRLEVDHVHVVLSRHKGLKESERGDEALTRSSTENFL